MDGTGRTTGPCCPKGQHELERGPGTGRTGTGPTGTGQTGMGRIGTGRAGIIYDDHI